LTTVSGYGDIEASRREVGVLNVGDRISRKHGHLCADDRRNHGTITRVEQRVLSDEP
jgi:hypothetical protein